MTKSKIRLNYQNASEELKRMNLLKVSGLELVYKVWKEKTNPTEEEEIVFCTKFFEGFMNRPSVRVSGKTKTVPDKVISYVISGRIKNLDEKMLEDIKFAHKISMGAENIIGSILEEYIHVKLIKSGWSICWGNSFAAVDLCSNEGKLIQIKNKSNTENSSSSRIRQGTEIQKWYRMNANTGAFCWDKLTEMTGCKENPFSEEEFEGFARLLISNNHDALFVDEEELKSFLKK